MQVDGPVRTVEIRSPSARAETANVLRATFHVALWSALLISAQTSPAAGGAAPYASLEVPFVRKFQDLDARDQRVFRALQEGIGEAERRRSATGAWPTTPTLAADGIPPFAADPIDKDGYVWTLLAESGVADYVGTPAQESGRGTFLVVITEPDRGAAIDPDAPTDEAPACNFA